MNEGFGLKKVNKSRIIPRTSRDRPKSASYPRLKNSKKTSKCQVLFYSTRKSKFKKKFKKFTYSKKWTEWRAKVSQCRKTERGDPLRFFNIHSVAKHQKNAGGTLWGKIFFFEKSKSRSAEKNERGESLVSPGIVCYAEKQEKPFWFSSLDQIVHFDAIIFCRTFVELFWSVRVDRKKRVTIIVAFHFMKRRLKTKLGPFSLHFFYIRKHNQPGVA